MNCPLASELAFPTFGFRVVGSQEGGCALKTIKHCAAGVDLLLLLP